MMSNIDNPYGGSFAGQMTASAQPSASPQGAYIKDTTTKDFGPDVIDESRNQLVLVDFWAPWCGPCKQLAPIIEKVVNEAGGRVKLVKLDIDQHPAVPGQLGIQSIPAVVAFKDGRPIDGFMGAVPESQIREFIEKNAGPAVDDKKQQIEAALSDAAELLATGDIQTAGQIYSSVMQADPENPLAFAGIAECLMLSDQHDRAAELLSDLPEEIAKDSAVQLAQKKIEQFIEARKLGDPAALRAALSANEDDHEARVNLAKILNAQGDRMGAAEELLTVMRKDRTFDDDGARRQLLEFFDAWGFKDPATVSGRRKLSSLLFS
jgi:putative thioredoxin